MGFSGLVDTAENMDLADDLALALYLAHTRTLAHTKLFSWRTHQRKLAENLIKVKQMKTLLS